MTSPCVDCGQTDRPLDRRIGGWTICRRCTRRRHHHPSPCPSCDDVRVLAFPQQGQAVCADCAGEPSPFACPSCKEESGTDAKKGDSLSVMLREQLAL